MHEKSVVSDPLSMTIWSLTTQASQTLGASFVYGERADVRAQTWLRLLGTKRGFKTRHSALNGRVRKRSFVDAEFLRFRQRKCQSWRKRSSWIWWILSAQKPFRSTMRWCPVKFVRKLFRKQGNSPSINTYRRSCTKKAWVENKLSRSRNNSNY